jgi:hypothetical protein
MPLQMHYELSIKLKIDFGCIITKFILSNVFGWHVHLCCYDGDMEGDLKSMDFSVQVSHNLKDKLHIIFI